MQKFILVAVGILIGAVSVVKSQGPVVKLPLFTLKAKNGVAVGTIANIIGNNIQVGMIDPLFGNTVLLVLYENPSGVYYFDGLGGYGDAEIFYSGPDCIGETYIRHHASQGMGVIPKSLGINYDVGLWQDGNVWVFRSSPAPFSDLSRSALSRWDPINGCVAEGKTIDSWWTDATPIINLTANVPGPYKIE